MDITEAKAAKRSLEQTIALAIRQFEAATSTTVESVRLDHLGRMIGGGPSGVTNVTVEARL